MNVSRFGSSYKDTVAVCDFVLIVLNDFSHFLYFLIPLDGFVSLEDLLEHSFFESFFFWKFLFSFWKSILFSLLFSLRDVKVFQKPAAGR